MPSIYPLLFSLTVFVILTIIGIKKQSVFPKISSVQVLFRERFISGNNGGIFRSYRNILDVVVTDQELWIRTFLPFSGFGAVFKGIHKVPVSAVQGIETRRDETTVYFINSKGSKIHFSFRFSKTNDFIQIIQQLNKSVIVQSIH